MLFWELFWSQNIPGDFLDPTTAAPKHDEVKVTTPKFHKEELEKDETIKVDFDSKFKTSTDGATDKATTEDTTHSKTTDIPKVTTTSHSVPLDDHSSTTEAHSTTVNPKSTTTTAKPSNVSPVKETHWVKWIVGETFIVNFIFLLILRTNEKFQKITQKLNI